MKRKLKKLEQVLAENPTYRANGISFIFDGVLTLYFSMIHYFGKEINMDHPSVKVWEWDESWFEQTKKKKLYAYFNVSNGQIIFFQDKQIPRVDFIREPDFDIEFGGEE